MDILLQAGRVFWRLIIVQFGEEIIKAVIYTNCGIAFVALTEDVPIKSLTSGHEFALARLVVGVSFIVAVFRFIKWSHKEIIN